MNIIKKTLLFIGFLTIPVSPSLAQYQYGGLTFGEENGKICRFGASGKKTQELENQIYEHLWKCEQEKRNPFEWDKSAPAGVNTIFRVSGDLDRIHKLLNNPSVKHPCWMWASATGVTSIRINLHEDGFGWVDMYEGDELIGCCVCRSSVRKLQPKDGFWSLGTKCTERQGSEQGHTSRKFSRWMAWAIPLNNEVEGIYLHAGSFLPESQPHGCVRLPHPCAKDLYGLVGRDVTAEVKYR